MSEKLADTGRWSEVEESVFEAALACARGTYQRQLILGGEAWSGSTLQGTAKKWGMKYQHSRGKLHLRLVAAGLSVTFDYREKGRKVLVIKAKTMLTPDQEKNAISDFVDYRYPDGAPDGFEDGCGVLYRTDYDEGRTCYQVVDAEGHGDGSGEWTTVS